MSDFKKGLLSLFTLSDSVLRSLWPLKGDNVKG